MSFTEKYRSHCLLFDVIRLCSYGFVCIVRSRGVPELTSSAGVEGRPIPALKVRLLELNMLLCYVLFINDCLNQA